MVEQSKNFGIMDSSSDEDDTSANNQQLRSKYMLPKKIDAQQSRVGPKFQVANIPSIVGQMRQAQSSDEEEFEKYMQMQQAQAIQRRMAEEEKDWDKYLKPKNKEIRVGEQFQAVLPVPKPPASMLESVGDVQLPQKRGRVDDLESDGKFSASEKNYTLKDLQDPAQKDSLSNAKKPRIE